MISKLTEAFKSLRKAGYFARQNFKCCQSCAWAEVPDSSTDKVVFYHQQDKMDLDSRGRVHLAWAGDGAEICAILNAHGVQTEWSGDSSKRILAIP